MQGSRSTSYENAITGLFVLCLVFSVVLSNQAIEVLQQAGRTLHILSIAAALLFLYTYFNSRVVPFLVVLVSFFALGEIGYRPPYEAALLCLSFYLGLTTSAASLRLVLNSLLAVVFFTTIVMFLQVIGFHEDLYRLSSQTQLPSGEQFSITVEPTFLVGYDSLEATLLQGRPAGILHSNQFASFVIIVAAAIFLGISQKAEPLKASLLALAAVLTLAKIITLFVLISYLVGRARGAGAQRENSGLLAKFYFIFFIIYFVLFPGVVTAFFLNAHTIVGSVAARVIDILVPLGIDQAYLQDLVASIMNALSLTPGAEAITEKIIIEMSGASTVSLYALLMNYSGPFAFGIALLFLSTMASTDLSAKITSMFRRSYTSSGIFLLMGFAVFGIAADFSRLALFWYVLGLAVSWSLPEAFRLPLHRARNSSASSESIRSQDGTA